METIVARSLDTKLRNIMAKLGNGASDEARMENIEYIFHVRKSP
jgi:hypothetical protein